MFPAGKQVHEGSARRLSGSSSASADSPVLTTAVPAAEVAATPALPEYPLVDKKTLSNPDAWGGNRLFMGRAGKEVHEPARRPSASSATKPEVVPKSSSPPANAGGGIAAAIAGRRRSSASQGGVFSGLMANRTSHEEKRQGYEDMKGASGSFGGFMSNLVASKPAEKK